eukprot:1040708-Pyramimonas_sp.AAC.1
MRAQAAMCSARWNPGACTTTVLGLISPAKDDPQFRLRYEQLANFCEVWQDLGHTKRMEVSRCWDIIVEKCSKTRHRWQCVRGPLASTVAVLLDLNALPHSP